MVKLLRMPACNDNIHQVSQAPVVKLISDSTARI